MSYALAQRGVRAWKFFDGMLDLLPTQMEWTEDELVQWLATLEMGMRAFYRLPHSAESTPKEPHG